MENPTPFSPSVDPPKNNSLISQVESIVFLEYRENQVPFDP